MINKKEKIMVKKIKGSDKLKNSKQEDLFDYLSQVDCSKKQERIKNTIISMLKVKNYIQEETWRGAIATPPGSFIEVVLNCFNKMTNIPLEIPFFTCISFISSYLLKNGIHINFNGGEVKPDIWTVILAESGAGKSFSTQTIKSYIEMDNSYLFPDFSSSAKFIENLEKNNNTLYFRDEFGQFLKSLESPQLLEMKDYFLRLYDNNGISRSTLKSETIIENPSLSILGVTVLETFLSTLGLESLTDGLGQRFNYVIAKKDENRKMIDFPLYETIDFKNNIKESWDKCLQSIKHKEYILSDDARDGFKTSFSFLCTLELPESYYRRIMYKGIKYSLIYHVILQKESNVIDAFDMGWAGRICSMHIKDSIELLSGYDKSDLQNLLLKAEEISQEFIRENKRLTARDLIRRISKIKTAQQAKALIDLL